MPCMWGRSPYVYIAEHSLSDIFWLAVHCFHSREQIIGTHDCCTQHRSDLRACHSALPLRGNACGIVSLPSEFLV